MSCGRCGRYIESIGMGGNTYVFTYRNTYRENVRKVRNVRKHLKGNENSTMAKPIQPGMHSSVNKRGSHYRSPKGHQSSHHVAHSRKNNPILKFIASLQHNATRAHQWPHVASAIVALRMSHESPSNGSSPEKRLFIGLWEQPRD